MKSSAIVKKALHKADGVLYPVAAGKIKSLLQYQVATSCNESFFTLFKLFLST